MVTALKHFCNTSLEAFTLAPGRRFFFVVAHHMASTSLVCFTHNATGRRCFFIPHSYNSCCHSSTLDSNCMWTVTTNSTKSIPHFHINEISSACWYGQSGQSKVTGLKPVLQKEEKPPASDRVHLEMQTLKKVSRVKTPERMSPL